MSQTLHVDLSHFCHVTMCQTAYFYFSCLGWIITSQDLPCLFPCFAEPLTALLQPQWKVCARPYKAITIWKQWASERDDSSRQQSSYHSGCKRDIAEREHAIIWMPSWKAETMHSLARSTHTVQSRAQDCPAHTHHFHRVCSEHLNKLCSGFRNNSSVQS